MAREADKLAKRMRRMVFGFAATVAAPLLGAVAVTGMVKKYTDDLKRLNELSKKRNLSLKERQERQELLNKYTEKDIKLYEKTTGIFDNLKDKAERLGRRVMEFLLPAFAKLAQGLAAIIEWVTENTRHWKVFIPLLAVGAVAALAKLIPAVWAFTAALLANPITWFVLALVALGIVIDDLITHLNGGESALQGLWEALGSGGDVIYDVVQWFSNFDKNVVGFFQNIGRYWGDLISDFVGGSETVAQALAIIAGIFDGLWKLLNLNLVGAWNSFHQAAQAAINIVSVALDGLMGLLQRLWEFLSNKVTAALDAVKKKAEGILDIVSAPGQKLGDIAASGMERLGVVKPVMDNAALQVKEAAIRADAEARRIALGMAETDKQAQLAQLAAAGAAGAAAGTNIESQDNSTTTTYNAGGITVYAQSSEAGAIGNAVNNANNKMVSSKNNSLGGAGS